MPFGPVNPCRGSPVLDALERSLSYRNVLLLLQEHSDLGPGCARRHRPNLSLRNEKDLGRRHRDFRRMHANEQMALAVNILQPSADEVISSLEIQPGERFIDPEEIYLSHSRDDFGKYDARFLTIALGKEAIPPVFDLQP